MKKSGDTRECAKKIIMKIQEKHSLETLRKILRINEAGNIVSMQRAEICFNSKLKNVYTCMMLPSRKFCFPYITVEEYFIISTIHI